MRTAADRAGALVVLAVIPTAVVLFGGGGSGWLAAAVVVPVLAGLAASAAAARLGLPDRLETRLLAAGLAVLILLALLPAGLDGRSALGALGDGAAQLVTGTLPLVAGGPQLGIAVVSFSVATVVSVEVARKDGLLLPLVSPLLLYAAVLLVTAGGPPGPRYGALLVAAGSGLTIVLRHQRIWWQTGPADPGPRMLGSRSGRRPLMGPTLVGLVLVGVVGLVAWAGAGPTALPGSAARQPYDLRTAVSPGPVPLDNVSLLARFASIHDGPVEPSFSATVLGPPPGSLYWRLATFDQIPGIQLDLVGPLPFGRSDPATIESAGRRQPGRARLGAAGPTFERPARGRYAGVGIRPRAGGEPAGQPARGTGRDAAALRLFVPQRAGQPERGTAAVGPDPGPTVRSGQRPAVRDGYVAGGPSGRPGSTRIRFPAWLPSRPT